MLENLISGIFIHFSFKGLLDKYTRNWLEGVPNHFPRGLRVSIVWKRRVGSEDVWLGCLCRGDIGQLICQETKEANMPFILHVV